MVASNGVVLNGNENWHWEVPDTKIDEVIALLNKVGFRNEPSGGPVLKQTNAALEVIARGSDDTEKPLRKT